jgi:sugar-phosphatase
VLLDIDGTLIDSGDVVRRCWQTWAIEYGVDVEQVLKVCHGRRSDDVVAQFLPPPQRAAAAARELALELADLDGITALPGARRLLEALPVDRWAAVTSGERALMTARLTAAQLPIPKVLISGEDVTTGKPSPQGYLKAADALDVNARQCLVVEDAPAGVRAGRFAGAQVLALTTTHKPTELPDTDAVVPDLSHVTAELTDDGRITLHIS